MPIPPHIHCALQTVGDLARALDVVRIAPSMRTAHTVNVQTELWCK